MEGEANVSSKKSRGLLRKSPNMVKLPNWPVRKRAQPLRALLSFPLQIHAEQKKREKAKLGG